MLSKDNRAGSRIPALYYPILPNKWGGFTLNIPFMKSNVTHQFGLFGFVKPQTKVPISTERIKEAQELLRHGDHKGAALALRDVRERLENFEQRLNNKKAD